MDPINVLREGEMQDEVIRVVARPEDPLRDELLRGMHNDVTLTHIASKLPRGAYAAVASINRDWQRAFKGRMVYDARVQTNATQEFLLVSCLFLTDVGHEDLIVLTIEKRTLSLFSPNQKRWYRIPPIPGCHEGVLHNECAQAVLDGSLYFVGVKKSRNTCWIPSAEVLVLDVARYPSEWRQCANMKVPRLNPTVRVMHGKIFVFGGSASSGDFEFEVRNEVYDPTVDKWSFMAPPIPLVSIAKAFSIGQQLFACIGSTPIHPVQNFFDKEVPAKFVVTVDEVGPKIRSTEDPDAEDDMDGLHKIIEKELSDGPILPSRGSPTERFASTIRYYEESRPGSFFLFYDPVNDEWGQFNKEKLETATVDEHLAIHDFSLESKEYRSHQDDDGPEPYDDVTVYVRSISL